MTSASAIDHKLPLILRFVATTLMIAIVVTDVIRVALPGQPAFISFIPLGIAAIGAVAAPRPHVMEAMPTSMKAAMICLVVLCSFGSVVSAINTLPLAQIIAGWIAYAGCIPTIFLGFALARYRVGRTVIGKWTSRVLLFSVAVAFFQQFGVLEIGEQLEDFATTRGVESLGTSFVYTTGPFRTAGVFAIFLTTATLIVIRSHSDLSHDRSWREKIVPSVVVALATGAAILAARRSAFFMLLGALLPYVWALVRKGTGRIVWGLVIAAAFVFVVSRGGDDEVGQEVQAKLVHSTIETNAVNRLQTSFEASDSDLALLTVLGDGLGSHGPSVRAGDLRSIAYETRLLIMHPILHYGWFKDLLCFGPIGFALHLAFFFLLIRSVTPRKNYGDVDKNSASRFSATGFAILGVFVYQLVSTAWFDGITGGLLFGLSMGFCAGYLERNPRRVPNAWASAPRAIDTSPSYAPPPQYTT